MTTHPHLLGAEAARRRRALLAGLLLGPGEAAAGWRMGY